MGPTLLGPLTPIVRPLSASDHWGAAEPIGEPGPELRCQSPSRVIHSDSLRHARSQIDQTHTTVDNDSHATRVEYHFREVSTWECTRKAH